MCKERNLCERREVNHVGWRQEFRIKVFWVQRDGDV